MDSKDNREDEELDLWKVNKIDKPLSRFKKKKGLKMRNVRDVTSDTTKMQRIMRLWMLLPLLSRFSRVWLCNPIDGSPPGSPVPGILQARTLESVAISFSKAWKWKVKGKSLSCVRLLATPWTAAYQAPPSMGFSKQEYWSGVPLPSPLHLAEKYFILERLLTSYKTCIHLANIYPLNMGQKRLC